MAPATIETTTGSITASFNALRLLDRPSSTAAEVAEALESDATLSAQVLRMARSPLCGVRSPDLTVGRAVVLLGFVAVRKVAVLSICRELGSRPSSDDAPDPWRRALWVGIAAEQVAHRLDPALASDALMQGMLGVFADEMAEMADALPEVAAGDQAQLQRILRAADALADLITGELPGLPATAKVDDTLEHAGIYRLEDGRLAVDIRRGFELYTSLFN